MNTEPITIELSDLHAVRVYTLAMRTRFRGITVRRGILLEGPGGWGEFCPFEDYSDVDCVPWLASALESCSQPWPEPVRDTVPVNCTVPALDADQAHAITAKSGCRTAKVKIAERGQPESADLERVAAVRDALGPSGAIRVDANAAWDVDTAVARIRALDAAAGGLEYVEQPCRTVEELAAVRRRVEVPIAADESIRRAEDPLRVALAEAADVAVLKAAPLGGVRRALQVAEACGLPCVVSSAVETSVGLTAEVALAAALPELPYACGLATMSLLDGDVTTDSVTTVDGHVAVRRQAPEPAESLVVSATPDATTQRLWLGRLRRVHALLRETVRRDGVGAESG